MKLQTDDRTRAIFEVILACLPAPMPVYLVGGAVRDMLLGLPVKDLDFVVPSDSLRLARAVRRNLGAAGFTLDDERQTARLILAQGTPSELILDFVSFTGMNLQEDLSNRDFTINTLAVALDQPDLVLDFLGVNAICAINACGQPPRAPWNWTLCVCCAARACAWRIN